MLGEVGQLTRVQVDSNQLLLILANQQPSSWQGLQAALMLRPTVRVKPLAISSKAGKVDALLYPAKARKVSNDER